MPFRSNGTIPFPSLLSVFLTSLALAHFLNPVSVLASGENSVCGNGVVEEGEDCDPGSALGSPDCDTLCREVAFEPPGLPFEIRSLDSDASLATVEQRIYSPRLQCAPFAIRDGARNAEPAHVLYRIHLCQNSQGKDAFTTEQVRGVMAAATAEFARGGVVLEEESLVHFSDVSCDMPINDPSWQDTLREQTPPGVMAVAFVSGISSSNNGFAIGGFCSFGGPLCVNAGAYPSLVVHEMGHFFGLAHTFECAYGIETPETCSESGDLICDTPPDRGPLGVHKIAACEGGALLDGSCSGTCDAKICQDGSHPDAYDWMGYYHCDPGHFTDEQKDFMRCMLDHEMVAYNADATTTTTSSSTTTTLADPRCGDVTGDGDLTASDALGILRAGVGLTDCPDWVCDYNGSGILSASDALDVLRVAVGMAGAADCPHEPAS